MANCAHCKQSTKDYTFRALTVQTLILRDIGQGQRIQTLREFETISICQTCAQEKLTSLLHPSARLRKLLVIFGAMLVVGALVCALLWDNGSMRMFGLGAMGAGLMGILASISKVNDVKKEYTALSPKEALDAAAWACAVDELPKKWEDTDLTYIPVTPKTLAMKNGDLMLVYSLVPDIARQAYALIHDPKSSEQ
ncbi:hypothetical protein RFF05_11345 [Bengtsoniella intestinalis]|uniref:hypothetical protein n=1 Tax=Bengtsoniella intestinalis TaxID=3073143 RepID=UPI00391F933B